MTALKILRTVKHSIVISTRKKRKKSDSIPLFCMIDTCQDDSSFHIHTYSCWRNTNNRCVHLVNSIITTAQAINKSSLWCTALSILALMVPSSTIMKQHYLRAFCCCLIFLTSINKDFSTLVGLAPQVVPWQIEVT